MENIQVNCDSTLLRVFKVIQIQIRNSIKERQDLIFMFYPHNLIARDYNSFTLLRIANEAIFRKFHFLLLFLSQPVQPEIQRKGANEIY